jgi:hypothetical protein
VPAKSPCSAGTICTAGIKWEPLYIKVQVGGYAKGTTSVVDIDNMAYGVVSTAPGACPDIRMVSESIARKVGAVAGFVSVAGACSTRGRGWGGETGLEDLVLRCFAMCFLLPLPLLLLLILWLEILCCNRCLP